MQLKRRVRRAVLTATILLSCIVVAMLIATLFVQPPDLLLVKNVTLGMTESEVVSIFRIRPTEKMPYQIAGLAPKPASWGKPKYWYCDAGIVEVCFGADGRVTLSRYFSYGFSESPIKRKLRYVLGWFGLSRLI